MSEARSLLRLPSFAPALRDGGSFVLQEESRLDFSLCLRASFGRESAGRALFVLPLC